MKQYYDDLMDMKSFRIGRGERGWEERIMSGQLGISAAIASSVSTKEDEIDAWHTVSPDEYCYIFTSVKHLESSS